MTRRSLLAAAATTALLARPVAAATPAFDPIPPRPGNPTPGKPGDFDFLAGDWRIAHKMIKPGSQGEWIAFAGEATCWTILGGVGSVEELRIPARDFSGMGLRMLNVQERVWSDFWVNAKSGVLTSPGQTGSFENGAGIFMSDYEADGRTMISAGIWDRISATTCRWRQASSADGGKTWDQSWIMDWRRA